MLHNELTKNHDKASEDRQTWLYSTGLWGEAFLCMKMYKSKLNPLWEAFFQKPKTKDKFQFSDSVWYQNKPLGVNHLLKITRETFLRAKLLKIYTNHSVWATAITRLSNSCVSDCHIMNIFSHVNEQSLASYNSRPSTSQLKNCSDILSTAMQNSQAPVWCAHGEFTSWPAAQLFLATTNTVNSWNIGQPRVFMLPQNSSIFTKP